MVENTGATADLIEGLLFRWQVEEAVDYREHSRLILREAAVDLFKEVKNMIALDAAGDAGKRLQKEPELARGFPVSQLDKLPTGLFPSQFQLPGQGQGTDADKITVEPIKPGGAFPGPTPACSTRRARSPPF